MFFSKILIAMFLINLKTILVCHGDDVVMSQVHVMSYCFTEYRCTHNIKESGLCIPDIKLTHVSFRHEPPLPGIFSLEETSTPKKKSVK